MRGLSAASFLLEQAALAASRTPSCGADLVVVCSPNAHHGFRGSVGLAWEADRFTVGVPHRFAKEWNDLRFREPAEEALARVAGRRLALVVEVTAPPRVTPAPTGARRGGWAARRRALPAEQRPEAQPEVDPDPRDPE